VSDKLRQICGDKRTVVKARKAATPLAEQEARAAAAPPPRGFHRHLAERAAEDGYGLICEIKRASPSKGLIRADFDPPALARDYAAGGATCLSVLTDELYFQGRDAFLEAAHKAVELPVLRKDFMLEPYQIVESRALGADCVLLIMAALADAEAAEMERLALDLGMDVLIEVHDEAELERALALSSPLIGINNRNLKTLEVDLATCERLAPRVPAGRLIVAESGLAAPADLERMLAVGAKAFLIGESLMRQDDVTAATAALVGVSAPAGA
jgi:indole-3-glycerol phosphate synthase